MKPALSATLVAATLISSTHALADDFTASFGGRGQVAVSGERLFGYSHISQKTSVGGQDRTVTNDSFSLFSNSFGGFSPTYHVPRLALDAFIADNFSLGGSVSIARFSSSTEGSTTGSVTAFTLAPRLGFAATLGSNVAIWPRAGLTYVEFWEPPDSTLTMYALSLEVPLVFTVGSHFGILAGLTADIGLGGEQKSTSTVLGIRTSVGRKTTEYGVQFGLVGYI
jgi:hypothetical protein